MKTHSHTGFKRGAETPGAYFCASTSGVMRCVYDREQAVPAWCVGAALFQTGGSC